MFFLHRGIQDPLQVFSTLLVITGKGSMVLISPGQASPNINGGVPKLLEPVL